MIEHRHIYTEGLEEAEFDLELFSRMNMHEGRMLYLVFCAGGACIQYKAPDDQARIHMMALNGRLFVPK